MNACFRDVFLIAPNVKLHPVFLVDRKIASSVRNVKTIVRNLYRHLRCWIQDFFTGEGGGREISVVPREKLHSSEGGGELHWLTIQIFLKGNLIAPGGVSHP